jgi:lipopolysaccharide biosynthesis glycosyltransferase
VPAEKAAVYVFLIDDDARVPELSRFLAPYHIRVVSMSSSAYSNFNPDQFNPSHISAAALGRFSLEGLLPDKHRRIVYLDGDTWMRRDPSALLEASITEGKIAAVEDTTYFRYRSPTPFGRTVREYFARLGLSRRNGYFNSGVLAASRLTWRSIMADAHKFFAANTAACKNHDQNALNSVTHAAFASLCSGISDPFPLSRDRGPGKSECLPLYPVFETMDGRMRAMDRHS